jgi:hypothetical protein
MKIKLKDRQHYIFLEEGDLIERGDELYSDAFLQWQTYFGKDIGTEVVEGEIARRKVKQ